MPAHLSTSFSLRSVVSIKICPPKSIILIDVTKNKQLDAATLDTNVRALTHETENHQQNQINACIYRWYINIFGTNQMNP